MIAGEGVAGENRVAAVGREVAIGFVGEGHRRELSVTLQQEWFGRGTEREEARLDDADRSGVRRKGSASRTARYLERGDRSAPWLHDRRRRQEPGYAPTNA